MLPSRNMVLLFPLVATFLNDSPEIFTPSSTPAQQIAIKKIPSFSTFGSCGTYTDPKYSQTRSRLLSMPSSSFTFTSSRAIISFRFPLQGGQEVCQAWSMCLAWTSAGSPLPVPTPSLQPAAQTLSALLPELHWQ